MSRGKVRGGKRRTRSGVYRSSRKRFRDHGIGLPRTVVSGFRPVPLRFNGSGGDRRTGRTLQGGPAGTVGTYRLYGNIIGRISKPVPSARSEEHTSELQSPK